MSAVGPPASFFLKASAVAGGGGGALRRRRPLSVARVGAAGIDVDLLLFRELPALRFLVGRWVVELGEAVLRDLEQLHGRVVLRRDRDELVVLRLPRGRRLRDGLVEGGDAVRERRDLVRQLRDALRHLLDGRCDALDLELQVLLLVVRGLELGLAPLLLLLVRLLLVSKNNHQVLDHLDDLVEAHLLPHEGELDQADLVVVLGDEQKADEEQKKWCETEFESSDDKKKYLKFKIEGIAASIEEMTEGVAKLSDEITALTDGITALDKSVAEATATRKTEHDEFVTVSAQNNAAVQLLEVAKNRLAKFYNPTTYKKPERRELTEEEQIYVNSGGADPRDAEGAAAPQGIAGTGVAVFLQL